MHTLFIIFGSTGDLAKRKLFPAMYNIFQSNQNIDILSVGRKPFDTQNFREYIFKETKPFLGENIDFEAFREKIEYSSLEISQGHDYEILSEKIHTLSHEDTQIIIYLSIAPEFFIPFIENSCFLPLNKKTKIIFEKPFGNDLESACKLNDTIREVFREEQIYRIDHYVGKDAIQNILAFRFANSIFEPLWNNQYIDNIQITAYESIGVENRGAYYENSGALRDMVQNHLFQVLALTVMDAPANLDAESIQAEKLKVLRSIKKLHSANDIIFGQYEGYTNEPGVDTNSSTETFVAMKVEVANWRMSGVPIYLKTGKCLQKKSTQIVVEFKDIPDILFQKFGDIEKNRIILEIQPHESINIHFNIKSSNNPKEVQRVHSRFNKEIIGKEAYEKLLEDVIIGDKTLFTSFRVLKESWEIVNDLITLPNKKDLIHLYKKGTNGPQASYEFLLSHNAKWYE